MMNDLELQKLINKLGHDNLISFAKNNQGYYLAGNESLSNLAGLTSPKEIFYKADKDLIWHDNSHVYYHSDAYVKTRQKTHYFLEKVRNAKNIMVDFLIIKAPFIYENLNHGTIGVGIALNNAEFNHVLLKLVSSADNLNLQLDYSSLLKICAHAIKRALTAALRDSAD